MKNENKKLNNKEENLQKQNKIFPEIFHSKNFKIFI